MAKELESINIICKIMEMCRTVFQLNLKMIKISADTYSKNCVNLLKVNKKRKINQLKYTR